MHPQDTMKTIFITISDGEVAKNILETKVFDGLAEAMRLVLLVHPKSVDAYRHLLGARALVEPMPRPSSARVDEFFGDLFLYSVHTESLLVKIEHSFASQGSLLGKYIKKTLWFLGGFYWYRAFWRSVYALLPDHTLDHLFTTYQPDVVLAANLTSNEDARLIKTARRFRVRSFGLPKGWDNLTLKTFLPVFPDRLLVQTELMKKDAGSLDVPEERVTVVGFPKFDIYAQMSRLLSRGEFMERFGFDPNRKLILYAGAGDQLAPYDEEILARFLDAVERGEVEGRPQVLVRPHPKYRYDAGRIPPRPFWKLDWPGKRLRESGDFRFDEEDVVHLMNSLYHCDLLIHTASTLGIEAAHFDRPSVTIAYDGDASLHPALSVARYYRYTHLARVMVTGGMKAARNFAELLRYTNDYLRDPALDHAARARVARENAGVIDGHAGERVAAAILQEVGE